MDLNSGLFRAESPKIFGAIESRLRGYRLERWQKLLRLDSPGDSAIDLLDSELLKILAQEAECSADEMIQRLQSGSRVVDVLDPWWQKLDSPMPEHYHLGAFSQVRTSLPPLRYAREVGGKAFEHRVLRELQVSPKIFEDPSNPVSLRLLKDVLGAMRRHGFSDFDLFAMGQYASLLPENQEIRKEFTGFKSFRDVYEYTCEEVARHYEKNFHYEMASSSSSRVILQGTPREQLFETFKDEAIDSSELALYRLGVASAHSEYAGFGLARTQLISYPTASDPDQPCMMELIQAS